MYLFMDPREEQRAWLESVIAQTGIAATTLASRAGLAPTTLTRFLNNPTHSSALSARTLAAVEKVTGLRFGGLAPSRSLREPEAQPYDPAAAPPELAERLQRLVGAANGLTLWTLRGRALETIGYLPGDILLVDLNAPPRRGDVVCAQVYDFETMRAETIFRLYEPPYLVAASADRRLITPRLVDENVGLKGPVLFSFRGRAAA
jgi:hypothetical protein